MIDYYYRNISGMEKKGEICDLFFVVFNCVMFVVIRIIIWLGFCYFIFFFVGEFSC